MSDFDGVNVLKSRLGLIATALLAILAFGILAWGAQFATADDFGDDAFSAFPLALSTEVSGELERADDLDFFSFTARADAIYRMETFLVTLLDSVLTLYDADGVATLAINDDCGSSLLRSCLAYIFSEGGVYYLEVSSFGASSAGTYSVLVREIPAYLDDHGNTPSSATPIEAGQKVSGKIEIAEDMDFFKFTARAGQRYQASTALDGLRDSILTLYGSNGVTILSLNDDCSEGVYYSCLEYTFTEAGAYYLAVTSYGLSYTGRYSILLKEICLTCVVQAEGMVFMPNPVVSSRDPTLRDNYDADSDELNNQRVRVTFHVFEPDASGAYKLDGPYATARGRASESTPIFNYTRSNDRFEEVMAYYHVDLMQRYIQETLGFKNVSNRSVPVIANGITDDNSYYDPINGSITFGSGGVDDAEDAEIIAHEYGHAIQDDQVRFFGLSSEGAAMGEGFGDYWAASFYAAYSGGFQDECIAEWDASGFGRRCLRRVDGTKHYPEDLSGTGDEHADGEIWSATLWEIKKVIGRENMDRTVIQSHFYLDAWAEFVDGALALIQSDQDLYEGLYECVIKDALKRRGILDSPCTNRLHASADASGKIGATKIPVNIVISTADVIGFISFTVSFDSSIVTSNTETPCETATLTAGWTISCESPYEGAVTATLAGPSGMGIPSLTQGAIAVLYFDVNDQVQAGQQSPISFSNLTIRDSSGQSLSASGNDGLFSAVPACSACDANGDGEVDITDVILMLRMALELDSQPSHSSDEFLCLDKNMDSHLNILDAIGCVRHVLGLE